MKPSIIIDSSIAIYYHDIASEDGKVEKITPEEAKEKYESILESQDRDAFASEKNLAKRRVHRYWLCYFLFNWSYIFNVS